MSDFFAVYEEHIARLEACTDDSYVLAFENGLGIRYPAPGQPAACALWMADAIVTREQAAKMPEEAWAFTPSVRNGAGEQAELMPRQVAIAREIASCKSQIEYWKANAKA